MSFNFWLNYLRYTSLFFAFMGLMWAVLGSFDPFGIYDQMMSQAFFNTNELPTAAKRVFRFVLAPFGATAMGYFILQYYIATHAVAKREKWGLNAITIAFFAWFFLDTTLSIMHGAWFNVMMANIPSLIAMTPPLYYFYKNI